MNKISPYIYPGCYLSGKPTDEKRYFQKITLHDITYLVCNRTGISLQQIRSQNRRRDITDARHIIYYLANKHLPVSKNIIIAHLQDSHHRTTMVSACRKISDIIYTDPTFAEMIRKITVSLMGIDIDRQLQKKAA